MADTGTGSTIAFGTSSYSVPVTNMTIDGEEVEVIEASHFGTTGFREKIFGDLKESPQITVDVLFDPNAPAPVAGAEETVTITFPIPSGDSAGATLAGTAKIISTSVSIPLEDVMTAQYVIQFKGNPDPVWAVSS